MFDCFLVCIIKEMRLLVLTFKCCLQSVGEYEVCCLDLGKLTTLFAYFKHLKSSHSTNTFLK